MSFDLSGPENDNFNGNLIYERLPDGKWIEVNARATGSVQTGRVVATGQVALSYWAGFPGRSSYSVCRSDDFVLTFTPR